MAQQVKNPSAMQETQEMQVRFLGQEDPLEEDMKTHSSILAWEIPWREGPGGLQSMGSHRVGHHWATTSSSNEVEKEICIQIILKYKAVCDVNTVLWEIRRVRDHLWILFCKYCLKEYGI